MGRAPPVRSRAADDRGGISRRGARNRILGSHLELSGPRSELLGARTAFSLPSIAGGLLVAAGNPVLVMLSPGARLFAHHIEGDSYNFTQPLAVVEGQGSSIALRNLSSRAWTSRASSGDSFEVPPGAALPLSNAQRIHFGTCEAEVRF